MKLSTLQKALADAGVDQATAKAIVKGQLEAGELDDDLAVDDDTLDRHMDAVAKAMGQQPAPADNPEADPNADPTPEPAADPINKGGSDPAVDPDDDPAADDDPDADPGLALTEIVDRIAKGAQDIVDDVSAKHEVLAKAYLDLGATAKAMSTGLQSVAARQDAIEKALTAMREDLAKAMGQPVPPRAQDFEPVPHPGDGNGADPGVSLDDVMNKAWNKLKETTDEREKYALKSAIANLEIPGCNHQAIAKSLGL